MAGVVTGDRRAACCRGQGRRPESVVGGGLGMCWLARCGEGEVWYRASITKLNNKNVKHDSDCGGDGVVASWGVGWGVAVMGHGEKSS